MADPIARGVRLDHLGDAGDVEVTDESLAPKWRVFAGFEDVRPGTARRIEDGLVWSVSPGEWTVVGSRPPAAVDLTHVRAMFRLTGTRSADLLAKLCSLDFDERVFGSGGAARTLVAGVATEIVRDDRVGRAEYLLVPSRSFGVYLGDVLADAGEEFAIGRRPSG